MYFKHLAVLGNRYAVVLRRSQQQSEVHLSTAAGHHIKRSFLLPYSLKTESEPRLDEYSFR